MSEQAVLWLFGVLLTALFALVGFLAKIFWAKLSALDSGALAAFIAKDAEREKAWWEWRKADGDEKRQSRAEVKERLDSHAADIKDMQRKIARLNGAP